MTKKIISWHGIAGFVISILVSFVVYKAVYFLLSPNHNYRKSGINVDSMNVSNALYEQVYDLNKKGPMWIDSVTEFVSAAVTKNKTIQYNMLLKIDRNEYDLGTLKIAFEKHTLENLEKNPSYNEFKENEITIIYDYSDMKKDFLFQVELTPDKYK